MCSPSITPSHLHALFCRLGILKIRASGQIILMNGQFDKLESYSLLYEPFHLDIKTKIQRINSGYTSYSISIVNNDNNVKKNQYSLDMELVNQMTLIVKL